jgi:hypothetical protein
MVGWPEPMYPVLSMARGMAICLAMRTPMHYAYLYKKFTIDSTSQLEAFG